MSANSSCSLVASSPHPSCFDLFSCFDYRAFLFTFTGAMVNRVLILLPLYISVVVVGYRRWRQQRSFATVTHCDLFTYHVVIFELIGMVASILQLSGYYANIRLMFIAALNMYTFTFPGHLFYQCLTCIEHYLAVVHPITYLGLRRRIRVKISYLTMGFVLLLCFGYLGLMMLQIPKVSNAIFMALLVVSSIVVCFCSFSILCALQSSGPGEGARDGISHSRQRVFYTINGIMGGILLWLIGSLFSIVMYELVALSDETVCLLFGSSLFFSLPCSLVLPLLFLHRAEKLLCCSYGAE